MNFQRESEKENVELKSCSGGRLPVDFWEVVTAFSNLEGGTVYLGVDPTGNVLDLSSHEIDQLQRSVQTDSKNIYNHDLYPQISVKGNQVVAVYYPEVPASLKPIHAQKQGLVAGARVRVGSSNERMSSEWLRRFAVAAQGGAEQAVYRVATEEVIEATLVENYLETIRKLRGNDIYSNLQQGEMYRKLRIVDADGHVTLFGLLAFGVGNSPQEVISPNVAMAVTTYGGIDKVDPENAEETSKEDSEFYGNAADQFNAAYKYVLARVPKRNRVEENGRRVAYPAVPDIAIREALANALVHRDYSVTSSKVQVDVYADRIEFISPGRSLVPLHDLDAAHSETRNPVLMNYLRELGFTEQRARGIRTIKTSLRKAGLLDPLFLHRGNSFVATLYTSAVIADNDGMWLRKFDAFNLVDRQKNALAHIRNTGEPISNAKYREINHMRNVGDDARARAELKRLVLYKLLQPKGDKKSRKYELGVVTAG